MANSTFVVGLSTATFNATISGFKDAGAPPWREMTIRLKLASNAAWETLLSLRSGIGKTATPGGTGTFDVLNGPGAGTLTIASLGAGTAYLTDLSPEQILPAGKRFARATFLLKTWTAV